MRQTPVGKPIDLIFSAEDREQASAALASTTVRTIAEMSTAAR